MRVLFIGPLPEPMTGQALACRVILDRLPKTHQVDLVNLSKQDLKAGFSSISRASEIVGILWAVWRKRKYADAVYLTVSESSAGNAKDLLIYVLCFSRLQHMVVHLLGGANMRNLLSRQRPVMRSLNVFFLRRLAGVIVEGETQAGIYRDLITRERIHVVPNFAEDSLFTTHEQIDRKFSRPSPLRILFLSNLLPGKGHDELVAAFLALDHKTRGSVEIDFAGAFESEAQKERFLARIAGVANLRYHGTVHGERKRDLLHQAHVFCLPTYYAYEGQPISILEAYASGCAVITTNHSGIRDVFSHEVNGLEVAARSVADLGSAIERAATRPQFLHAVARTNLETALQHHRTAEYGSTVVSIIERAAAGVRP